MQVTHSGIEFDKVRKYDTDVIIYKIDRTKTDMKLSRGFRPVTASLDLNNADVAFNGGGWGLWSNKSLPNEYLVIDSVILQAKSFDGRPCIAFMKDGDMQITHKPSLTKIQNCIGFDRVISAGGVYNTRIRDNSTAPRTAYGFNANDKKFLYVLTCEGRRPGQKGLTFKEIYEIMKSYGCTEIGNADGGYSTAAVNNAVFPNLQIESYRTEFRSTVYQVLFYSDSESNPIVTTPDEIKPDTTTMLTLEDKVEILWKSHMELHPS